MIKLAAPSFSTKLLDNINNVLSSGHLVQGTFVKEFEEKLQLYLGVNNAIAVSSGTSALHLSLMALDIGIGDEVIVPSFTYPATANVVENVGANIVLIDISLDDYCLNIDLLESAISSKTKAIMPVHEFGMPANIDVVMEIASKYNLHVIEDAACALGSLYNNINVGTFGDFGCFSFHPRKAITTGEGGLVVTDSTLYADRIRSLRNHGVEVLKSKIEFNYAGLNYRMTDIQAALGLDQFSNIDELNLIRKKQAKIYFEELEGVDWILLPKQYKDRKSIFQSFHILIEKYNRDSIIKYLRERNIESNIGAYAINMLNYYKNKYKYSENDMPNSMVSYTKGLVLPIGKHVLDNEIYKICKLLKKYK